MSKLIYSFSGTQGTGKTTAAYQKAIQLKQAYPDKSVHALVDLEAFCPFQINQGMTEASQSWIFANQLKSDLDALAIFDIVVTDRTIVDSIAYTLTGGFEDLAADMVVHAASLMSRYHAITIKHLETNDYSFVDGIRDTDVGFRKAVQDNLIDLYQQLAPHITGHVYDF